MKALQKTRCVDAFTLKIIMAVLMLMDHLYYFLPGWPYWFHQVSRLVAPIFAFLIAEGMAHTSNRPAYIGRLFAFGGVMLAADAVFLLVFQTVPGNSILISLAITASMIFCIDKLRAKTGKTAQWIALLVLLTICCLFFEGAFLCPVIGLVCYYLRGKPLLMCAAYVVSMTLVLLLLGMLFDTQGLMLLAVFLFPLYNGKRGMSNKFSKYFFYVFYPIHIWVLFLIQQLVY